MMHDQRPAALQAKENSFNAIRLFAALQVVAMHGYAHLHFPSGFVFTLLGQFPGVPIFFAVSGFLVFDSFLRSRSVPTFGRARALRIYPGLIVNIVVLNTLFALGGGYANARLSAIDWVAYQSIYMATASQDFAHFVIHANPNSYRGFFSTYPSGVLWTLTVELTFYVTVPIFGFLTAHRQWLGAAAIAAASALSIIFVMLVRDRQVTGFFNIFRLTIVAYFWMFGIGMLSRLFITELLHWRTAIIVGAAAVWLALAWASNFSWLYWKYEASLHDLLQIGLLCLLVSLVGTTGWFRSMALLKVDLSYGIYLWHMLFTTAAMTLGFAGVLPFTAVLTLTVVTAWLSWNYIEKPALSLKKRGTQTALAT